MIRSRLGPTSIAIALAMSAIPPGQAVAQDQAAIEKLVQMNKKALDDYDTLEWDVGQEDLLDALVAGKKAGLDNHPVMARTYVHLGAVYITGFKNRDKAIQSFNRALEIDPAIQLSKGIATPEVNEAFRGGQARTGRGWRWPETAPPPGKKRKGPVMEGSDEAAAAPKKRAPREEKSSTSDDDSEEKDLPVKIAGARLPDADEAIIDKAGHVALRGRAEPSGRQGVPDVPGARQGGVHRAGDDEVAQGLVRSARSRRRRSPGSR